MSRYLWNRPSRHACVANPPLAHPATGATHAGTTLVLGSVPAALINLRDRALAHGRPHARQLTKSLVPSSSRGKAMGRIASAAAFLCFVTNSQEPPEVGPRAASPTPRHRGRMSRCMPWGTTPPRYPLEVSHSSLASRLHIKGGPLSIAPQGLLPALEPSPPSLDHGIVNWHTSGGRASLESRVPRT